MGEFSVVILRNWDRKENKKWLDFIFVLFFSFIVLFFINLVYRSVIEKGRIWIWLVWIYG